jgi:hypothetical protein
LFRSERFGRIDLKNRFWRTGVSEAHPLTVADLYRKKFAISASDKIATAGSCFAQHVANHMRKNGFSVMDAEPSPPFLSPETAKAFGYGIYSARYGNIYTVRQLLQLARDADKGTVDPLNIWTKGDRFYDALRPNIEPDGFDSPEEATALREQHLAKVKKLFRRMDVFIFTLGLTEAWVDKRTGRVFPTAPGTIAGDFDPNIFEFKNFTYDEIYDDFVEFSDLVCARNRNLKIILTVSPVPLTATATDNHVLIATTYSKSVLRAVAGRLADTYSNLDYFPSYEMIASPWSKGFFYEPNMREVNNGGVAAVMRVFFEQHGNFEVPAAEGEISKKALPEASGKQRQRRSKERASGTERQSSAAKDGQSEAAGERRQKRRKERTERTSEVERQGGERPQRERPSRAEAKATRAEATTEPGAAKADEVVCEDILLEAFNR